MMLDATIYNLTPAGEDEAMAGNATLRTLSQKDCFTSSRGIAWRVANDTLRLPDPTMRQHVDDTCCY